MAFRTDLSNLIELSDARAMLINGGDGPTEDPDGVCDAESVGNIKTENQDGFKVVSTCTEKVRNNGESKFVWKLTTNDPPK